MNINYCIRNKKLEKYYYNINEIYLYGYIKFNG